MRQARSSSSSAACPGTTPPATGRPLPRPPARPEPKSYEGEWTSENEHRQAAQEYLLERGFTHALIPDGDEIIEPALLQTLTKIAANELAERVYVHWDTYWKSPEYVIRPREGFTPLLLVDLRHAKPVHLRHFEGGRGLLLPPEHGLVHHLSYVGPDERIRRKIATWGHREEVQPGWYEHVWRRWDTEKLLRNLHPTHPPAYGLAERIPLPALLQPTLERYQQLAGEEAMGCPPLEVPSSWPRVSVVIPLHGGPDDLCACLESLERCQNLLHEVVVVDNASPDEAAAQAARFPFVRLLQNDTNRGFPAACNQGLAETSGEVVLFLNSDTLVPRAGLLRLIESLTQSGSIAAAGPYTNYSGHSQQIAPTYTTLDTLDRFAEDFACRPQEDGETDMLVGFCLAVKRSVLEEVGGFDERFGLGTFEDNDLCYRMRRAGYRLVLAARSFVHHHGSRTLHRLPINTHDLLARNEALYRKKWQDDLQAGYASHLSGLSPERIVFEPARHPEVRLRRMRDLARRADLSLCMIVRDEERVLGDALASARLFFSEMIVVDTGSKDRTREIARDAGAKVYDFPWCDSFSAARNESLRYAKGKWLFWMDADDTLPWSSGEALLHAALNAPPEVMGFVVPVQFVEDGASASGTRVDHVKLFRRLPDLAFEGRIHEQILPSLRRAMPEGLIARCEALVLHSGYDTSPEGQAKKRRRDLKLLKLDYRERPNHPFVLFNLGMTYHYLGEHKEAIRWFQKCLKVSGVEESHLRKAYALLALSQREAGDQAACLRTLEEGLLLVPEDPELHFHAGNELTAAGRYEEARRHYLQVAEADIGDHFSSVDIGILGYKTYHNLGGLCLLMDDYPAARDWWHKAIEAAPSFLPSAFALFEAALEREDFSTARRMREVIRAVEGPGVQWAEHGARYARALGGPENAEAFLRRAVATEPDTVGPRLVLARRLLQEEREREAQEHLLALNEQGVAEAAYYMGVSAIRLGHLPVALAWMERAQELNPGHEETRQQVANLQRALAGEGSREEHSTNGRMPAKRGR